MKTIYKTSSSKSTTLELYDNQLQKIGCEYKNIFVNTSFGETHLIETGNLNGPPLLVFHGGNSTTAYNLLVCRFLLNDFHIYAVDIVGHPGKNAEKNYKNFAKEIAQVASLLKLPAASAISEIIKH